MKQIILPVAFMLTGIIATAQTNSPAQSASLPAGQAGYEAASWKTRLLDNPGQITIAAPPTAAQSKTELQIIKQRVAALDDKKREQIKYWNAGAPSYRWNQIVLGLVSQKQEVLLRMPPAWMNMAIYDATILALKEKIKYKR